MKNRFSIGEMSKLHNTTIKTLRYYDEIGLLEPIQIDENNGYRYYSTEQFEQLNIINYLNVWSHNILPRYLGVADCLGSLACQRRPSRDDKRKTRTRILP